MPKDEFDFDDPMELNGVALACSEDTSQAMADCFIEEFMRLGYNAKQILALFRNPYYVGMNLVVQKRGEAFVRERIAEIFARWGKPVPQTPEWTERPGSNPAQPSPPETPVGLQPAEAAGLERRVPNFTDPMGAPIPDLTV